MKGKNTYIVYSKKYNLYKIGRSKDIPTRVKTLTNTFGSLELIFKSDIDIEMFFHKVFCEQRYFIGSYAEWFKLSSEDLEYINKISLMSVENQSKEVDKFYKNIKISKLRTRIEKQKNSICLAEEKIVKSKNVLSGLYQQLLKLKQL